MADHAASLGIPVDFGSESMMERGRILLEPGTLVAGTVPFVLHALRRLGVAVPEHKPYPAVLAPWLHRRVTSHATLREALALIQQSGRGLFVKPAKGWKRFTGFIAEFPDDPRFNGFSANAPVWTSEVIRLVSEWRAYVAYGSVLAILATPDSGDQTIKPDVAVIEEAVRQLVLAGEAPAGFVIDFGVNTAGSTIRVETNDGFSFGAYGGLDAKTYWTVTEARWHELVASTAKTYPTEADQSS